MQKKEKKKKNRCFLREQFSSKLPGSQNYFDSQEYCVLIFLVTTGFTGAKLSDTD